jgi:molybdate transport system permease protein
MMAEPPSPIQTGQTTPLRGVVGVALVASALALFCFLATPLVALLWRALPGLLESGSSPLVTGALRLSLLTTSATTVIAVLVGTPTAYLLARYDFRGRSLLSTLVDLPMVLPPAVAGLALLMAFGRRGLLGGPLEAISVRLPFTTAAVVIAQTFVAAPFHIRQARIGFGAVDRRLENMAASLGVTNWRIIFQVTLPLSRRSLVGGAIMAWARALAEFGATIMFAGNFQGRTQTMPLAIYIGLQEDLSGALTLAGIMLVLSFSVLMLVRLLADRRAFDA